MSAPDKPERTLSARMNDTSASIFAQEVAALESTNARLAAENARLNTLLDVQMQARQETEAKLSTAHAENAEYFGQIKKLEAENAEHVKRVAELEVAFDRFMNSRDYELDMMQCEFRRGTTENSVWHKGVAAVWERIEVTKQFAKDALAKPQPAPEGNVKDAPTEYSPEGVFCSICKTHDQWCIHLRPPTAAQPDAPQDVEAWQLAVEINRHCLTNQFTTGYDVMIGKLAALLLDFAAKREREVLEKCCAACCTRCANKFPAVWEENYGTLSWWHSIKENSDKPPRLYECTAAHIRKLCAEAPGGQQ